MLLLMGGMPPWRCWQSLDLNDKRTQAHASIWSQGVFEFEKRIGKPTPQNTRHVVGHALMTKIGLFTEDF